MIKEELVKRFESVVREEIIRHDISVKRSNEDISLLKELFIGFKKDHDKLRIQHLESFKKTQDHFTEECQNQKNDFDDQRRFIRENSKRLDGLMEDFKNQIDEFVSCQSFDEYGAYVNEYFLTLNKNIGDSSNIQENNLFKVKNEFMDLLERYQGVFSQNLDKLKETIDFLKAKFEEYRVDSVGVLKELQVYKKTVFIMQKKIENLYTLIERLNKRVDS